MRLIRFRRLNREHWEIAFNEADLWRKLNGEMAEIIMPAKCWLVRLWRRIFPLNEYEFVNARTDHYSRMISKCFEWIVCKRKER